MNMMRKRILFFILPFLLLTGILNAEDHTKALADTKNMLLKIRLLKTSLQIIRPLIIRPLKISLLKTRMTNRIPIKRTPV